MIQFRIRVGLPDVGDYTIPYFTCTCTVLIQSVPLFNHDYQNNNFNSFLDFKVTA